ncbi:MAG TPA: hypothetical protein VMS12_13060 [Thermoanaerobaculia bacterium]|nr:hypothetical protein [Thermoanaerobaculia bacterium]
MFSLVAIPASGCTLVREYRAEPRFENRFSFALSIEDNQLVMTSARLGGRDGKFVLATGHQVTTVDTAYADANLAGGTVELAIGERFTADINPLRTELGAAADALLAADLWGQSTISIDYMAGMLTVSSDRHPRPNDMEVFPFAGPPTVPVTVDGQTWRAIIDTSLPDTLVLPRGSRPSSRARADIRLAGRSFEQIDVAWSDTSTPRIGNRLLSRFLVIINYRDLWVGLWPDPRI